MLIAASRALETHAFQAKLGAELIKFFGAVPEAWNKRRKKSVRPSRRSVLIPGTRCRAPVLCLLLP
jgi:hypothetical protein